jgi:hypothetical protein
MSGFLTAEMIFAAPDIETEDVFVPQWGGKVRIKGMTAAERDRFEESIYQQRGNNMELNRKNFRAKLVSLSAVDEEGVLLFSKFDIDKLGAKSAAAMDLLFAAAQRVSGISATDEEALTNVKNSDGDQDDDSSSG